MGRMAVVPVLLVMLGCLWLSAGEPLDPAGYLFFCPCMGRFGNQVDGYLGTFRLAKQLNRTLVLPGFVEYEGIRRNYPAYDDYFDVDRLSEFHRVMTAAEFFARHDNQQDWPAAQRTAFCYTRQSEPQECQMRRGQPSTDFWDKFNVQFGPSVNYQMSPNYQPDQFAERYPASEYPVVLMGGAPAPYPVLAENRELQAFMTFKPELVAEAQAGISKLRSPVLSVHIRNGNDWQKACSSGVGRQKYMESPQCVDPRSGDTINSRMCYPSQGYTLARIKDLVKQTGARSVFVGTDNDPWVRALRKKLGKNVQVMSSPFSGTQAYIRDLAVFSTTEYFLGNCVSSFTGFAKRYRDANGLPTYFFGHEDEALVEKMKARKKRRKQNQQKMEL